MREIKGPPPGGFWVLVYPEGFNNEARVGGALNLPEGPIYRVGKINSQKRFGGLPPPGALKRRTFFFFTYLTRRGEAIDSVAVLPFVNVNNDPNAEYLSDGLSDSIINSLSQLPNLKKVISLNSVLPYKGKQIDAQAVGRELNVRAVLMGRLTLRGDELLISTELVDVKDNRRLWGGQYNRKLADVFRLQGEIAQEISRAAAEVDRRGKAAAGEEYTDNPEAYRLYLLGRYYRRNRLEHQKARDYLEQAIKKDPNFAPAYAQLAYVCNNLSFRASETEARQRAEWAARRALELDDTLGDAHTVLGLLNEDTRELERALELDPNSPDAQHFTLRSFGTGGGWMKLFST